MSPPDGSLAKTFIDMQSVLQRFYTSATRNRLFHRHGARSASCRCRDSAVIKIQTGRVTYDHSHNEHAGHTTQIVFLPQLDSKVGSFANRPIWGWPRVQTTVAWVHKVLSWAGMTSNSAHVPRHKGMRPGQGQTAGLSGWLWTIALQVADTTGVLISKPVYSTRGAMTGVTFGWILS